MDKQQSRPTYWKRVVLVLVAVVIFLLPINLAHALSPQPAQSIVWFTFDYKTAQTPKLLGIQLITCETTNCEQPVLLQQYGTCEGTGCLTSPPTMTGGGYNFGCAANLCRSSVLPAYDKTSFKLVVQFSDRVRISEVVNYLPSEGGEVSVWRVIVREADLSVERGVLPAKVDPDRLYPKHPLWQFGISILVELVVAGLFIEFWLKGAPAHFKSRLGIVFLVNLLSLPVVWYFFPSMGQFQPVAYKLIGGFFLVVACVYAAFLAGIYRTKNRTHKWMIALTIVSLPVTIFYFLWILMWRGYNMNVTIQGLPANLVIFVSEIFAVAFDAFMITILSNKSLPTKMIWIMSFLMNATSFVAGLLLNKLW